MSLFNHKARQFKFDVLREISKHAFDGKLNDDVCDRVTNLLIPGKHIEFRCCIYKEKEIIRQRARMVFGRPPIPMENDKKRHIVHVIEVAYDGYSIHKVQMAGNCRGCMAEACLSAYKFDAIHMGEDHALIDYDKCKECGVYENACPFNAIVEAQRSCMKSYPVGAIRMGEGGLAEVDKAEYINCGAYQVKCPFGTIEDMSWMLDVIELLRKREEVYAVFAPAIQEQLDSVTLPQTMQAVHELGFSGVYEAAIGTNAMAWYEKEDAKKHKIEGKKITTSCYPAFVNIAKQHFPTVYEGSVSHMVSPMVAATRYLKEHHPNCKTVFVGPCIAKKQEIQDSEVDSCITFGELGAMFVSRHISPEDVPTREEDTASAYGRFFSVGDGVSEVVAVALKGNNDEAVTAEYADGSDTCKKALLIMKVNRFQTNILEGIACQGGCICGPAIIENMPRAKARMTKENLAIEDKTITSTLERYDSSDIDLHR